MSEFMFRQIQTCDFFIGKKNLECISALFMFYLEVVFFLPASVCEARWNERGDDWTWTHHHSICNHRSDWCGWVIFYHPRSQRAMFQQTYHIPLMPQPICKCAPDGLSLQGNRKESARWTQLFTKSIKNNIAAKTCCPDTFFPKI